MEKIYLRLYRDIIRTTSNIFDLDKALYHFVSQLKEVLGFDSISVYLLNETGEQLRKRAFIGKDLTENNFIIQKYLQETLNGNSILIENTNRENRYTDLIQILLENEIKNALFIPIKLRDKSLGVTTLFSTKNRTLSLDEKTFLDMLIEELAFIVERGCITRQLNTQLSYYSLLNQITRAINSSVSLKDIIDIITQRLPKIMNLKGCTIRLIHPKNQRLELVSSYGLSEEYLNRGSIDDEKGVHEALHKKRFVHIYDATNDDRVKYREEAKKEGIGSILAIPIIVDNKILGILRLLTDKPRIFLEHEIDFALSVAEQGGLAMKRAQDFEKIIKLLTEIEQQEAFLHSIFDSLNAGIVVLNKNRDIILANSFFCKIVSKDFSQVVNKKIDDVINLGEDIFKVQRDITFNFDITNEVGEKSYFEGYLNSIYRNNEELEFYVVVIRDITTQVLLDKETAEKQKLEGILELARTVAHELNTPLFVVLIALDILQEKSSDDPEVMEQINIIRKNIKLSTELIKKITQITKYQPKEYVGNTTILDLDKSL